MREISERLAKPLMGNDPRVGRHVRNRIVTSQIRPVGEALVHHAIKAVGFLHIALDGIGDLLRRIVGEVPILPGHWPKAANLPEQPLQHLGAPPQVLRNELTRLFSEIEQDGT